MKKTILILTGYNPRAVIAFLRELTACQVSYAIVASSSQDAILRTPYRGRVVAIRERKDLDLTEILSLVALVRERERADEVVILPSTEYLNRFLLRHRAELRSAGVAIPLVDEALYRQISDKEAFAATCERAGIKVPRVLDWDDATQFPVVAKPRRYATDSGQVLTRPALLYCAAELERFRKSVNVDDFLLQEFAHGRSFYLLYYFANDGGVVRSSQENFAQQKNGGSIVAAVAAELHHTPIAQAFEQLFKALQFQGLVMVEVRGAGDDWWMIEANPRLWGPSQLFVDAGVPLFRSFLADLGFSVPVESFQPTARPARYFWLGGFGPDADLFHSVDLHGCEPDELRKLFRDYLTQDVYLRPDTLELFHDELKKK